MGALVEAGETLLEEFVDLRLAVVNILELLREGLAARPDLVNTRGDSHAGEVETAVMLAAYPHLVKGTAAAEWPSFPKYELVRDKRLCWPGGVWGDPGPATAEKGEEILALETARLTQLIDELAG
jgi:creatinine amidohydrolase